MSETWTVLDVPRVIDGDTVVLSVERILEDDDERELVERRRAMRVRLVNLDTPERGEFGWADARDDVALWVSGALGRLDVETYGRDSLGRHLGDVYLRGLRGDTLTQWMLRERGWKPWVPRTVR